MQIDAMTGADENLVLHSWVRSWKKSWFLRHTPAGRSAPMSDDDVAALGVSRRDSILARPTTRVLVSRDEASPLFIYGWGCFERVNDTFAVHFIFVKTHFRHSGHARALLSAGRDQCGQGTTRSVATHRTYVDELAKDLGFEFIPPERLYRQEAA